MSLWQPILFKKSWQPWLLHLLLWIAAAAAYSQYERPHRQKNTLTLMVMQPTQQEAAPTSVTVDPFLSHLLQIEIQSTYEPAQGCPPITMGWIAEQVIASEKRSLNTLDKAKPAATMQVRDTQPATRAPSSWSCLDLLLLPYPFDERLNSSQLRSTSVVPFHSSKELAD